MRAFVCSSDALEVEVSFVHVEDMQITLDHDGPMRIEIVMALTNSFNFAISE